MKTWNDTVDYHQVVHLRWHCPERYEWLILPYRSLYIVIHYSVDRTRAKGRYDMSEEKQEEEKAAKARAMNYVTAFLAFFARARGRAIYRAVDMIELLR